jgi:hypothetical protein
MLSRIPFLRKKLQIKTSREFIRYPRILDGKVQQVEAWTLMVSGIGLNPDIIHTGNKKLLEEIVWNED